MKIPDTVTRADLALAVAGRPSAIPEACTSAALARLLGRSERWVATLKAAGRLPLHADGRIDLHAITRAGVDELGQRQGGGGLAPALAYDAALVTGASVAAHAVLAAIASAPAGEPAAVAAARGLREALGMVGVEPEQDVPAALAVLGVPTQGEGQPPPGGSGRARPKSGA